MPRYRSDESDENRDGSRKHKKKSKKRKGRSRSGSDSESSHVSSSRGKKSKRRQGRSSRSLSPDRGQVRSSRKSRSRSPSYDRYYSSSRKSRRSSYSRSRSKSPATRKSRYSRSPFRSRSRSPASRKGRRSRSTSRPRGQRRRSRSYSRERRSRSAGRSHSRRSSPDSKTDASGDLKKMNLTDQVAASNLTPAQQAEERMRLALKAAAAADQKLRQMPSGGDQEPTAVASSLTDPLSSQPKFSSYEESQSFANSVAAIDAGNFKQTAFKSSRSVKPQDTVAPDLGPSHDDAIFGSLAVTGFTIKPDPDTKPIELDPESIIHPSLFCDPEEKMDRWIERLNQLRKRKLEGDVL